MKRQIKIKHSENYEFLKGICRFRRQTSSRSVGKRHTSIAIGSRCIGRSFLQLLEAGARRTGLRNAREQQNFLQC